MKNFIGTYECKIDDKGRLKLPSQVAKQMENFSDESFVLKRSVFQKCLEVYPMKHWEKIMSKIGTLNRFSVKNSDFVRTFTAGVKTVEADSAGRLQVSKDLVQFAGLQKDVVITSAGELLEIWDKEAYEKVIAISEADFAALAEEVMGSIDFSDN